MIQSNFRQTEFNEFEYRPTKKSRNMLIDFSWTFIKLSNSLC
jgi:hypothetical protein